MKTDDKNIDQILKGLADFRPPAKPDWDLFYDKNRKDINASAGSWVKSGFRRLSSIVSARNILISLGFVIGIFAGFYFLSSDSSDIQIEDNSSIINNDNNNSNVENTFAVEPTKDTRSTDNEPETVNEPDQVLINNEKNDNVKVEPPVNTESTEIGEEGDGREVEKKGEAEEIKMETGTNTNTEEPVIIKKTVIIKDTIRITKPVKKVK